MRRQNLLAGILAGALLSVAGAATSAPERYESASRTLLREGELAMAKEEFNQALTLFETALVADPGNIEALVAIGRAHEAMGQLAIGLGYYRRALAIAPNDRLALKAQSLAALKDNAVETAEANKARLERICGDAGCPELEAVNNAIKAFKASEMAKADKGEG